jgi:hypothetical protein
MQADKKGKPMSHTSPHHATFGEVLSPAQQQALAALLAGQTVTAAATEAGVDRTTCSRWLYAHRTGLLAGIPAATSGTGRHFAGPVGQGVRAATFSRHFESQRETQQWTPLDLNNLNFDPVCGII